MANTTNFGWETPDDTDLVKDGAAAMRTLGNAIDTSFVDLKGGTTGQVLSKASNTDLDFTWTNGGDITAVTAGTGLSGGGSSGDVTLTNTVATAFDAKGDLVVGTGADTFAKLAVGTNDFVLTAASGEATGLKWAAVPSASQDWAQIATATLSSGTSYQFTGLTSYAELLLTWKNISMTGAGYITLTMNSNTTNGTYPAFGVVHNLTSATAGYTKEEDFSGDTALYTAYGNNASDVFSGSMSIQGCNTSGRKVGLVIGGVTAATNNFQYTTQFIFNSTSTISTLEVKGDSAFDAGTVTLWGSTK